MQSFFRRGIVERAKNEQTSLSVKIEETGKHGASAHLRQIGATLFVKTVDVS